MVEFHFVGGCPILYIIQIALHVVILRGEELLANPNITGHMGLEVVVNQEV